MGVSTANANVAGFCSGTGTAPANNDPGKAANCLITNNNITKPATIFVTVTMTKGGNQLVNRFWRARARSVATPWSTPAAAPRRRRTR